MAYSYWEGTPVTPPGSSEPPGFSSGGSGGVGWTCPSQAQRLPTVRATERALGSPFSSRDLAGRRAVSQGKDGEECAPLPQVGSLEAAPEPRT